MAGDGEAVAAVDVCETARVGRLRSLDVQVAVQARSRILGAVMVVQARCGRLAAKPHAERALWERDVQKVVTLRTMVSNNTWTSAAMVAQVERSSWDAAVQA